MARSLSILFVAFVLLITLPLWLGLGAGLIGLTFGIVGALIGVIFGLFGAIIGGIAWIFKTLFHVLFGWHLGFGFHPWFHFNGWVVAAFLILILAIAAKRKD